jgi:hypothetical protein
LERWRLSFEAAEAKGKRKKAGAISSASKRLDLNIKCRGGFQKGEIIDRVEMSWSKVEIRRYPAT